VGDLYLVVVLQKGLGMWPAGMHRTCVEEIEQVLQGIRGIGPWTAAYVCPRGFGIRDAFPASDLGLRQALGGGAPWRTQKVAERAEHWRPWRGYAAVQLWSTSLFP
jgi:3-methyladenine DNA glycosylase/8-oxoguanine DNA glycosylase